MQYALKIDLSGIPVSACCGFVMCDVLSFGISVSFGHTVSVEFGVQMPRCTFGHIEYGEFLLHVLCEMSVVIYFASGWLMTFQCLQLPSKCLPSVFPVSQALSIN